MIYFLAEVGEDKKPTGLVKVGYTSTDTSLARRDGCQTGNPRPLRTIAEIPGKAHDEKRIHRHLQPWRVGGEWFQFSEEAFALLRETRRHLTPDLLIERLGPVAAHPQESEPAPLAPRIDLKHQVALRELSRGFRENRTRVAPRPSGGRNGSDESRPRHLRVVDP